MRLSTERTACATLCLTPPGLDFTGRSTTLKRGSSRVPGESLDGRVRDAPPLPVLDQAKVLAVDWHPSEASEPSGGEAARPIRDAGRRLRGGERATYTFTISK